MRDINPVLCWLPGRWLLHNWRLYVETNAIWVIADTHYPRSRAWKLLNEKSLNSRPYIGASLYYPKEAEFRFGFLNIVFRYDPFYGLEI